MHVAGCSDATGPEGPRGAVPLLAQLHGVQEGDPIPRQWAELLWAWIHIAPLESNKMKMLITKRETARAIRDVLSKLETVIHMESSLAYAWSFFHLFTPKTVIYWTVPCPHATYLWQAFHNESPCFQFISVFQRHLSGIVTHWNAAKDSLCCMVTTGLWFWKRKFHRWVLQIKLASSPC